MSQRPVQNYANHAHRPTLAVWAGTFGILALGFFVVEAMRRPGPLPLGLLCLAIAVLLLTTISRVYIVRLQDRIIRLEMRMRLARLGRDADFDRLSTRQLVALRFASDAELPGLIDKTLAGSLSGNQIKQAVRDWQADVHRT